MTEASPLFLDTSALLRASLTKDQFHAHVQTAITQAEPVVVSRLAYPELVATLIQRQHRDHVGRLGTSQVSALLEQFREDWDTLYVVPVDEALLLEASALVMRQAALGLRAMDAIHVASALLAAEAFEGLQFFTFRCSPAAVGPGRGAATLSRTLSRHRRQRGHPLSHPALHPRGGVT